MLDLGRLRLLRELKLRGTVGAVAEALGYSPSAVSQQLAQLQKDVNVPLVEKAGRRLRLTEAGEVLAGHAEVLLTQAQRAEEEAVAASGRVAGTVRVAGYQTALIHLLAPQLPGLTERYPELTVEVIEDEFIRVLQSLVLQELDLVISDQYTQLPYARPAGLTHEVLFTELMRIVLPVTHPLAAAEGPVAMADLAKAHWVTGHVGTNHTELLERACVELGGFRPDIRHRTNDIQVMLVLVGAGQACCLFPDIGQAERAPGVVVRDVAEGELERLIMVWTRDGAEVRPSVRVVLDALRVGAAELCARRPALTLVQRPSGE